MPWGHDQQAPSSTHRDGQWFLDRMRFRGWCSRPSPSGGPVVGIAIANAYGKQAMRKPRGRGRPPGARPMVTHRLVYRTSFDDGEQLCLSQYHGRGQAGPAAETLRVLKKGGVFALNDANEAPQYWGMNPFLGHDVCRFAAVRAVRPGNQLFQPAVCTASLKVRPVRQIPTWITLDMSIALACLQLSSDWQDEHRRASLRNARRLESALVNIRTEHPAQCRAIEAQLKALNALEAAGSEDLMRCAAVLVRCWALSFSMTTISGRRYWTGSGAAWAVLSI